VASAEHKHVNINVNGSKIVTVDAFPGTHCLFKMDLHGIESPLTFHLDVAEAYLKADFTLYLSLNKH
jgi:hypothetical protein